MRDDDPNSGPVRTLCRLPPDAVPLDVIEVCLFMDTDGNRLFVARYQTSSPMSTLLGLLRLAEHKILHDSTEWVVDPEGE